jgi:hypothetical protein
MDNPNLARDLGYLSSSDEDIGHDFLAGAGVSVAVAAEIIEPSPDVESTAEQFRMITEVPNIETPEPDVIVPFNTFKQAWEHNKELLNNIAFLSKTIETTRSNLQD